jgi:Sulfotransferase domain.
MPDVRLVASLRNPVDRAYSTYWHALRLGAVRKSLTFPEFIEREARDFGSGWATAVADGCYSTQLRRYYRQFRHDQILVVLFEDLIRDPASTMTRIMRHITPGSDSEFTGQFPHSNPAHLRFVPRLSRRILNPRGKPPRPMPGVRRLLMRRREAMPPMDAHVRAMLTDLYRPWNRELESMIDRPLTEWGV